MTAPGERAEQLLCAVLLSTAGVSVAASLILRAASRVAAWPGRWIR